MMYHYIGVAQNQQGDALPNWYVEAHIGDVVQPIYADAGGTLIQSISGVNNRAKVDESGNFDFWIAEGTYDLYYYNAAGLLQTKRDISVNMGQIVADLAATTGAGLVGTTGGSTVQADLNARPSSSSLAATSGAGLVGTTSGGTVQSDLTARPTSSTLAASTGAGLVGTTSGGTVQSDLTARPTSATLATTGGAALIGAVDGASGSLWTTVQGFITKLLSSAGSSVIGFIQAGTGAIMRAAQDKMRESVSVKDFGAKGDGQSFADGAITATSATFSSATASFTAQDVGKLIVVNGAGTAGAPLITTIAAYVSATQVTLAAAAVTTVSGASFNYATNDTAAIQAAHTASTRVFYPTGNYGVSFTGSTPLVSYANVNGISVRGDNAKIYDFSAYGTQSFTPVFQFDACTNMSVIDLNYEGIPIVNKSDAANGIGYVGASFILLKNGCTHLKATGNWKYLRYGILAGAYTVPSQGYNNDISCNISTFECGYPVALYLSSGLALNIYAESSHRAAYLAGCQHGYCYAYSKDQYIAPIRVLLTDATTNNQTYPTGTSRGCANLDIRSYDMGSTIYINDSFMAGISQSRGDAGITYENIKFDVGVVATDTVASRISGVGIYNSFLPYQPSYPDNWSQQNYYRNIKVTGLIDRSQQTVAENSSNGEIYIYMYSTGTYYATASGIDISGFRYLPGSGSKPRGFYYVIPGLQDNSTIENCSFGAATPFVLYTNATSQVSIRNTTLQGTSISTSDSPFLSNVVFTDCSIANMSYQPLTNKVFTNTAIQGAGTQIKYMMTELTLSGASVTWSNSLPNNSIILGVSGRVTQDITGATGFTVGTGTSASRFFNTNTLTSGTTFTVSNGTDTSPQVQVGTGNIIVTAKTSNFTGGKLRLQVAYMQFTAPTS